MQMPVQPSVYFLGLRIDEPVTMLTDLLISLVCFYAAYRLRKISQPKRLHTLIIWHFLTLGTATFLGGVMGHGFLYAFHPYWKLPGWLAGMLSVTILELVMILYSEHLLHSRIATIFLRFSFLKLAVLTGFTFGTLNFTYAAIHSGFGLLVMVLGFCLYNRVKGNSSPAIKNFIWGVVFSFAGGLLFITKTGVSKWFTHADTSHILLAASAWLFYRGSRFMMREK